jgi:hypothetical protein
VRRYVIRAWTTLVVRLRFSSETNVQRREDRERERERERGREGGREGGREREREMWRLEIGN